jgi:hypothetical protein
MKRMTASDVRRNWFRVLDEVLAGETVAIERDGRRVFVSAEDDRAPEARAKTPDYSDLVRGDVEHADGWSWEWPGAEGELEPRPPR